MKLTKELIQEISTVINDGGSNEDAAIIAGINRTTFYEWLAIADDKPNSIYADFSDAVKTAKVKRKLRRTARIEAAAKEGNWQADAWYLERVYPEEFAKRDRTEHTGANGGPIVTEDLSGLTPEQRKARIDELIAKRGT